MTRGVRIAEGLLDIEGTGRPLLAGEVQFWRMDVDCWEPAVRAARESGVQLVSTYLSWRRHESGAGEYDFTGRTDPRLDVGRFLRICRSLDMPVQLKPGPWICAEEPGGGYPDRLLARKHLLARDDRGDIVIGYNPPFLHPVPSYLHVDYLAEVKQWFAAVWNAIGEHVHPLGPVVALQLDNEPSSCFQDSMYGNDYNEAAVTAWTRWLRDRYPDEPSLGRAWGTPGLGWSDAQPPRRPAAGASTRGQRHDWIEFKTHTVATHLGLLREMHEQLGGKGLLYTVNLVTHPVHDVPSAHADIRKATGALTGEDHYYVPPLRTEDIDRLARSAATARAAGEPLPWVPELQAGIWRSPGEVVNYPDPTPEEQGAWWAAALALGFGGVNLYMLVDRENWQHAPLGSSGAAQPFAAPLSNLVDSVRETTAALARQPRADVVVAWHRPDAYDAYTSVGTARVPEVSWHDATDTKAYGQWLLVLQRLTAMGAVYDFWDTRQPLGGPDRRLVLIPPACTLPADQVSSLQAHHDVVLLDDGSTDELEQALGARPQLVDESGTRVPRSMVTIRHALDGDLVHVVRWGARAGSVALSLPGGGPLSVEDLVTGAVQRSPSEVLPLGDASFVHRVLRVLPQDGA